MRVPFSVKLASALAASFVVLAAAPITASAIPLPCNPKLKQVKSFHGHAHLAFSETATGTDPGEGGTVRVALNRAAAQLDLNLNHKSVERHTAFFTGKVSGGGILVTDTYFATGTGFSAEEEFGGALANDLPDYGSAFLQVRQGSCKYQLDVVYHVATDFTGDSAAETVDSVDASGFTWLMRIPYSLDLSGGREINAYPQCPDNPLVTGIGCYEFGGTWTSDFVALALCGSIVPTNCEPEDTPLGKGNLDWNLSPTFKKPH